MTPMYLFYFLCKDKKEVVATAVPGIAARTIHIYIYMCIINLN